MNSKLLNKRTLEEVLSTLNQSQKSILSIFDNKVVDTELVNRKNRGEPRGLLHNELFCLVCKEKKEDEFQIAKGLRHCVREKCPSNEKDIRPDEIYLEETQQIETHSKFETALKQLENSGLLVITRKNGKKYYSRQIIFKQDVSIQKIQTFFKYPESQIYEIWTYVLPSPHDREQEAKIIMVGYCFGFMLDDETLNFLLEPIQEIRNRLGIAAFWNNHLKNCEEKNNYFGVTFDTTNNTFKWKDEKSKLKNKKFFTPEKHWHCISQALMQGRYYVKGDYPDICYEINEDWLFEYAEDHNLSWTKSDINKIRIMVNKILIEFKNLYLPPAIMIFGNFPFQMDRGGLLSLGSDPKLQLPQDVKLVIHY